MSDVILGSIVYLHSQEVDNLLASIEGGLVQQFVESTRETKEGKGEGGLTIPGTALGVSGRVGAMREQAREAIGETTPVSRLSALRRILLANEYVTRIKVTDLSSRDQLRAGQLVEVYGAVQVSKFDTFVDIAAEYLDTAKKFSFLFGQEIDDETTDQIGYLKHVTEKGVSIRVSPPKLEEARRGFEFAAALIPEHLRSSKDRLRGRLVVLARVERLLAHNEIEYPYALVPGVSTFPRERVKVLIGALGKNPFPGTDLRISEEDLSIRYPTVILEPIAVYS